jgi:hypothetical protein
LKTQKLIAALLAASLMASAPLVVRAADKPATVAVHPDSSKWEDLIKPDLSNATFPKGVWYVEDGTFTANADEAIWSQKEYENFVLDLEFKNGDATNSGVVIYATDINNWIPNSVEIQILDDYSPKWKDVAPTWKAGAIFGRLAPAKQTVKKAGEWNRMTVTAKGKNITVALNGEVITQCDMSKWTSAKKNPDGSDIPAWLSRPMAEMATKGRIGLQGKHGGAVVFFRNVKIKSLD